MKQRKNFVRELREAEGLTRAALADKMGCGVTTIVKLERGEQRLSDVWIYRISDALGVYPADLLDGGPERLRPRERALVDTFRGLTEEQQDAYFKATTALAQPKRIKKAS